MFNGELVLPQNKRLDATMSALSLWLEPEPIAAAAMSANINQLATRLGAQTFAPHITVIGGFQAEENAAIEQAGQFAKEFQALDVTFETFGFEDVIVRAAYLKALATHELNQLRARAGELFDFPSDEYLPHMSLLYSATVLENDRRSAVNELGLRLPLSVHFEAITLWRTEFDPLKPDFANWSRIMRVPLKSR